MKKTITRGQAIWMYDNLSKMAFGHFSEDALEKMMANYSAIADVVEAYNKLIEELRKRLYDGIDTAEAEKFNEELRKAQKVKDMAKRVEAFEEIRNAYGKLWNLLDKQVKVDNSLRMKEVEIEVEPIEKETFMKAAILTKADIPHGAYGLFEPLFKEEEKKMEDVTRFSELDELLK